MSNITSATNIPFSTITNQSNCSQSDSTDSLFQETLSGLQQTLENLATARGDSAISVKDANVGTVSGISGSQFSGPSLTVSGDLTETKIVNGKSVTQVDSFNYTQFQNITGVLGSLGIDFNIPAPQSNDQTSNEQSSGSKSSSDIGEVSALVTKYFSAIEGTISDNGKNVSILLAEINSNGKSKVG